MQVLGVLYGYVGSRKNNNRSHIYRRKKNDPFQGKEGGWGDNGEGKGEGGRAEGFARVTN